MIDLDADVQRVAPTATKEPLPRGRERLLLVEDDEQVARMWTQLLTGLGYRLTVCRGGGEALAAYRRRGGAVDLVITDQVMPGLTGLELAAALRLLAPDLPVILMTGMSRAVTADALERLGVRAFLQKPIGALDLARTVRRVLDGGRGPGMTA